MRRSCARDVPNHLGAWRRGWTRRAGARHPGITRHSDACGSSRLGVLHRWRSAAPRWRFWPARSWATGFAGMPARASTRIAIRNAARLRRRHLEPAVRAILAGATGGVRDSRCASALAIGLWGAMCGAPAAVGRNPTRISISRNYAGRSASIVTWCVECFRAPRPLSTGPSTGNPAATVRTRLVEIRRYTFLEPGRMHW